MTGKPPGAAPATLRAAIRLGLIRAAGEQRFGERVEELDRYADGALNEVRRFQKTHQRRRAVLPGVGPLQERLLQLLAGGRSVSGIAEVTGRTERQVTEDVRHLYELLGVQDVLGAVVAGYESGILLPGRAVAR